MADDQTPAPEAGDVVVQSSEAGKAPEAAEAPASTTGQVETPPDGNEGESSPDPEKSRAKERREKRKAEVARLRANAEQAEAQAAKTQEALEQLAQAVPDAPKQDDYPDYDSYIAALTAHSAGLEMDRRHKEKVEAEAKEQREALEAARKAAQAEAEASFAEQLTDARTRYQDFDAVVFDDKNPVSNDMYQAMLDSDFGADVAYYLGTHRDEAQRIAQLKSPLAVGVEIGRIEARLTLPKPKVSSTAPEPIQPVKPSGGAAPDPANMTMDQYRKWREGKS